MSIRAQLVDSERQNEEYENNLIDDSIDSLERGE